MSRNAARRARLRFHGLNASLALSALLVLCPCVAAAAATDIRTVVVLYPEPADGRPGNALTDQSIRAAFAAGAAGRIQTRNEYLDLSHFHDAAGRRVLADFLRTKYAGKTVDLVIALLWPSLDFALQYRDEIFPGVPIVFMAVDQAEVKKRTLPAGVIGVPIELDPSETLALSLRLHPRTRQVFVISGSSAFDRYWEGVVRRTFRPYEGRVALVYLSELSMDDLLKRVADLPDNSLIHYLTLSRDATGKIFSPAEVLEVLSTTANAPVYSISDSYVGRGIVGGKVLSYEQEGRTAAALAMRILAGERPEQISVPAVSPNVAMFDWRQLRRWNIDEASLPPGSEIRFREPSLWVLYRWHIAGAVSLFLVETVLIVALLAQRASLRRAEEGLRILSGRLLEARENESRRIARELHDDLGQGLALLTVELDLLRQKPPDASRDLGARLQALLARAKQLSSSVHDLSHRLHPAKLEQLGLVAAIGSLCKELTDSRDLKIEFRHERVPAALSPDTAVCLYRLAQEGLGNAIKHAGTRQAEVELSATADFVSLRIVDHGRGFDPRQVKGGSGLGLVSMRERVLHLGGDITIESQPSGGTRIHARIPLRQTVPEPAA